MKNPAVILAILLAGTILLYQKIAILIILLLFISIILLIKKKQKYLIYILIAPIAFSVFVKAHNLSTEQISNLAGTSIMLEAECIAPVKVYDDNIRATLKVKLKNGRNIKTLAYMPSESISLGDKFTATFNFYTPSVLDGNDREKSNRAKSIYILAKTDDDVNIIESASKYKYIPQKILLKLKENSFNILSEDSAALLNAICFGDTDDIDDISTIRNSGLSHVLAVSGMHLGFIAMFCTIIFGKKHGSILAMIFIVLFVFMLGATPSLLRASIMYFLYAISNLIDRENDSINSLSIAFLIILFINPDSIYSRGFQLSFAACIGILTLTPKIMFKFNQLFKINNKILYKIYYLIMASIACSLGAIITTFPLSLYHFDMSSILSPISNLLVIFPVSVSFVLGIISLIIYLIIGINPFGFILEILLEYISSVTQFISNLNIGVIYSEDIIKSLSVLLIFILIIVWINNKIKGRILILLSALILVFNIYSSDNSNPIYIDILAAGSGQAILVYNKDETVLIDCSANGFRNASELVINRLDSKNIEKIDTLILTAIDKTHARNVPQLIENIAIGKIIIPHKTRNTEIKNEIIKAAGAIPINEYKQFENSLGIEIIDSIDRKLIVKIGDITTVHSLTQKMLLDYLASNVLMTNTLIISNANTVEYLLYKQIIEKINPVEIILSGERKISGVRSTVSEGNIYKKME